MSDDELRHFETFDRVYRALCALIVCFGASASADRVFESAADVEPLAVGAQVPAVTVKTVKGAPVDLASLVKDRGALLVFYRGGW